MDILLEPCLSNSVWQPLTNVASRCWGPPSPESGDSALRLARLVFVSLRERHDARRFSIGFCLKGEVNGRMKVS